VDAGAWRWRRVPCHADDRDMTYAIDRNCLPWLDMMPPFTLLDRDTLLATRARMAEMHDMVPGVRAGAPGRRPRHHGCPARLACRSAFMRRSGARASCPACFTSTAAGSSWVISN